MDRTTRLLDSLDEDLESDEIKELKLFIAFKFKITLHEAEEIYQRTIDLAEEVIEKTKDLRATERWKITNGLSYFYSVKDFQALKEGQLNVVIGKDKDTKFLLKEHAHLNDNRRFQLFKNKFLTSGE